MNQPYPQDPVSAMIASYDGARVAGGCDYCDAYQVIRAHVAGHPGVHALTVFHDEGCPRLAAGRAGGEAT